METQPPERTTKSQHTAPHTTLGLMSGHTLRTLFLTEKAFGQLMTSVFFKTYLHLTYIYCILYLGLSLLA